MRMLKLSKNSSAFRLSKLWRSTLENSTALISSQEKRVPIPTPVSVKIFSQSIKAASPLTLATPSKPNASAGSLLKVSGPLGSFILAIPKNISVTKVEENGDAQLELKLKRNASVYPALVKSASQELLTIRAHLLNIFKGVTEGFMIKLNLVGLFYSVRIYNKGEDLKKQLVSVLRLNIGKSHPVSIEIPKDILISYKQVNFIKTILIYGISLERVTKIASEIRAFSPVERYKGKGFRFSDEFVVIKAKK